MVFLYLGTLYDLVQLHIIKATVDVCKEGTDGPCEYKATYNVAYYGVRWVIRELAYFDGLIGAIAGAFVAWFTFTLWRSTEKLWSAGEVQRTILDRQTDILRKQLVVQNPDVGYNLYHITIKREDPDILVLKEYRVALEWKNFGSTMATNVNYWMGSPEFVDAATDVTVHLQTLATEFKKSIFSAKGSPGHIFINSGATLTTDEFVVTREQLRTAFAGPKDMLIWCVVRYGSKLEDSSWFAEVAVWLRFVLQTDPDKPLVEPVTHLPFRVSVLGYRYRESND